MKLRSLLFGMMAAVAFTACSDKDDIPTPGNGSSIPEGMAMFSVKMDNVGTRAASATDAVITSLTCYVFNDLDGVFERDTTQTFTAEAATYEVTPFLITAGNKKVVLVANAPKWVPAGTKNNYTDFLEAKLTYNTTETYNPNAASEVAPGTLSMNSKTYKITADAGYYNYLGYTDEEVKGKPQEMKKNKTPETFPGAIKMFRNVAKINLSGGIKLGSYFLAPDQQNPNYVQRLSNPEIYIDSIFVLNANQQALLAGGEKEWSPSLVEPYKFFNGVAGTAYATYYQGDLQVYEKAEAADYNATALGQLCYKPATPFHLTNFTNEYLATREDVTTNKTSLTGSELAEAIFYVYENGATDLATEIPTLVVISGLVFYDEYENEVLVRKEEGKRRYFPIPVGLVGLDANGEYAIDGTAAGYNYEAQFATDGDRGADAKKVGILRNLQYAVGATLSTTGYEYPTGPTTKDNTWLGAKVQVVDWGKVVQNFVVE